MGVIFLDLMMPEMDGFEFIEELKKKPEHRPIPIVFVTSKDLTQADRLPLNGGIAKLIDKKNPLSMRTFSQESARHWKQTIPDSSVFFDTTFFLKLNLTY